RKIYFASKRAGGKGGSDIWMTVRLASGKWSRPINLGDSINTPGDEMAPVIHADGQTLYFSSNGHLGLGGYDLFVSKQDRAGRWKKAENLGYPINSNADDINVFLSIDGQTGWISSNRKGGKGGFDIYSFPTYKAMQPQAVFYVKGIVSDLETGKKLAAKVEISNLLTGMLEDSVSSDPVNGEFLLILHPGTDYAFNISKKGYLFYSENFNLNATTSENSVSKEFKLSPIQSGNSLVLNNIFFDFNSSVLKPSSYNELNKLAEMLLANKDLKIIIEGHTDNIGSEEYNKQLSAERAKSVYEYLVSNGIEASRMKYEGFGATMPVDTNETEKGRTKNRRTEVVVL
ncbi:MAG TPA: OmpA family protein, partial [Bacteroidales bacterium]